ncbi:MAG: ABC transporter ATP-binding protein [Geminicoccaceae bacterium]
MDRLAIQSVAKSYGSQKVLDDVSLSVAAGETVVVCGPSGAGKTVLLRLIAGTSGPDAGEIRIDGRPITGLGPEERDVGMAFQNFALYPHLSAFENIASPLRARGLKEAELKRKVEEVAALLRIGHVLGHRPKELSNGQKQRTALARSLVRAPGVLLLDDPLRNVDAKLRYEMRLELPRLLASFGSAVIYVTQDYKEAMALGRRIAVLRAGRFAQIGTPGEIYDAPVDVEVARLFGDPTINLYPCRPEPVQGGAVAELFGAQLPLPPAGAGFAGRELTVGIRAEDVEVTLEPMPGAVPVELDAVTPLNVRAVLYLRTQDGREMLATVAEDEAARFGRGHRSVWARVDPGRCYLFDPATGGRVPSAAA